MAGDGVLVVGSAHIDVMADYASKDQARIDRIGSVRYSIGGTGYNIAVNLGQAGIPTSFVTVLKKNSFSSVWIRERLASAGVRHDRVQVSDAIGESGFVAIRRDESMENAVTSSALSQYAFPPQLLRDAVAQARIVVADCNLPVDQLALLLEAAAAARRPAVVAAVSDSKVRRIALLPGTASIDLVMLNEVELHVLGFEWHSGSTAAQAQAICAALKSRRTVVTLGARGHVVLSDAGEIASFPAPETENVVSTSGAGDALLAGLVASWYRLGRLDPHAAQTTVALIVRRVLEQPGATVGSLAAEADFAKLAQIAMREEPLLRRFMTPEVGVAAAVGGVVVTLLVGLLQVWATRAGTAAPAASMAAPATSAPASSAPAPQPASAQRTQPP